MKGPRTPRVLLIESDRGRLRSLSSAVREAGVSVIAVDRIAKVKRWPTGDMVVTDHDHFTPLWNQVESVDKRVWLLKTFSTRASKDTPARSLNGTRCARITSRFAQVGLPRRAARGSLAVGDGGLVVSGHLEQMSANRVEAIVARHSSIVRPATVTR
jgi:hypothetical protein